MLHDADTKFTKGFKQVLNAEKIQPKQVSPVSPNLNAYVERFIQTIQQECLDHFVVLGERHLDHLVREFPNITLYALFQESSLWSLLARTDFALSITVQARINGDQAESAEYEFGHRRLRFDTSNAHGPLWAMVIGSSGHFPHLRRAGKGGTGASFRRA